MCIARTEILGKNIRKRHFYIASGIHILRYFHIIIFYCSFFLRCVEGFGAVESSGGMNDFAIWKGHLCAACLPGI